MSRRLDRFVVLGEDGFPDTAWHTAQDLGYLILCLPGMGAVVALSPGRIRCGCVLFGVVAGIFLFPFAAALCVFAAERLVE